LRRSDRQKVEAFMVRIVKVVIAVVFVSAIFGNVIAEQAPLETQAGQSAGQLTGQRKQALTWQVDPNDISAYYGFDEIEIIKLDWGIGSLRIADFDGDGRSDIAIVNNGKAKIELLVQKEAIGPGEAAVAADPNDIDINVLSPPTRFERQSVAVSQNVFSFVCGDLNSDEMVDLAFYGEPRGLYVILQKTEDRGQKTDEGRVTGHERRIELASKKENQN